MAQRIRRVSTLKEFERTIDDFITQGYKVISRGEETAAVIKRGKKDKHLLVFLLTFWFTVGFGNVIYALLPGKVEDEVLVRIEKES